MRASLAHDYLYWLRVGLRAEADMLFWQVLLEDGVPAFAAALMFRAVRIGGKRFWMDAEDLAAAALDSPWPADGTL